MKENKIAIIILLLVEFFLFYLVFALKMIFLFIPTLCLLVFLAAFVGYEQGVYKAKKLFLKEIKKIKLDNPYIYFREIPNNYSIGVSGLLLDFNLDKNDLIAAILDLCAKKYIKITEKDDYFEVESISSDYSGLFSNEMYIINWIFSTKAKDLNDFKFEKWKELIKNDALKNGLIMKRETKKKFLQVKIPDVKKMAMKVFLICFTILFVVQIALSLYDGVVDYFSSVSSSVIISGLVCWPVAVILYELKKEKNIAYKTILNDTPSLSELGKNEVQQLYALGNFIKDFGLFAEKHIEEIMIWEQYFSYAQLFGLTNYMLSTGYKKLTDNVCFKIKDISRVKRIVVINNHKNISNL